jgi:pimeloyl-ACP methyl ester carboxylesterase
VADGHHWRERPTVVLLHGGPAADHTAFKPIMSRLARSAQLIYLDQRGGGRSSRGTHDTWTIRRWTIDVRELCDALGITKPILLGQSFGTVIAMRYAIDYPGDVGGLVLASPYATGDLSSAYPLFRELGGDLVAEAAHDFWETPTPHGLERYLDLCVPFYSGHRPSNRAVQPGTSRARLPSDVLLHYAQGEHQALDLHGEVAKIQCPAILLSGGRDPITPPHHADGIVASMPPSLGIAHVLPEAGHHVFHEAGEQSFHLTEQFISQVWDDTNSALTDVALSVL